MNRTEARAKATEMVAQMTDDELISQVLRETPAIERLGIPAYNWWNEALHGVARAGLATVFPQAIAMAASFDAPLLGKVADVISTEARIKFNEFRKEGDHSIYKGLTYWSPNVNIFRDPRWGRGHETYGEDPCLTATFGKEFVRNMQGNGEFLKTAACAKHYAVHSGPEAKRHEFEAYISDKDLFETYLPAFEQLVKEAKVESVMGAYNGVDGTPCCSNKRLLDDILRKKWGFEGHVVSDVGAVGDIVYHHKAVPSEADAVAESVKAGCDLGTDDIWGFPIRQFMKEALEKGKISRKDIEIAAIRLLTTRALLGEFEEKAPYSDIPFEKLNCPEHQALNRQMADEAMVLLKNDGILPIDPSKLKSVAVIGPCANNILALEGNYNGTDGEYITVADGIRHALPDTRVYVARGCHLFKDRIDCSAYPEDGLSEALSFARNTDLTILCVGLDTSIEGEENGDADYTSGDKYDVQLPASQRRLVDAVCEVADNIIVVTVSGSALDVGTANEKARAILQAWYPGSRGGQAVADVLFGTVNPSGHLPVTFYSKDNVLPDFEDYSMAGRTYRYMTEKPLYPFGFGLSYTSFAYSDFKVEKTADGAVATVSVKNTGSAEGRAVTQIYASISDTRYSTPKFQLCGFASNVIKPQEEIRIAVPIEGYWLKVVTDEGERIDADNGIVFYAGDHQPDERSIELGCAPCLTAKM